MNTNARALLQVIPFFSPPVPRVSEPFGKRVVVDFQLRYLFKISTLVKKMELEI